MCTHFMCPLLFIYDGHSQLAGLGKEKGMEGQEGPLLAEPFPGWRTQHSGVVVVGGSWRLPQPARMQSIHLKG